MPQVHTFDFSYPMTVREMVLTGRLGHIPGLVKRYREKDYAAAADALAAMDLTGYESRPIAELSGGEQQRAVISRALAGCPELLILDEPFVGLDPEAFVILKEQMKKLCASGSSILFSSHILDVVENICNKVSLIKQGHLLYSGLTSGIVGAKGLEEVFM